MEIPKKLLHIWNFQNYRQIQTVVTRFENDGDDEKSAHAPVSIPQKIARRDREKLLTFQTYIPSN